MAKRATSKPSAKKDTGRKLAIEAARIAQDNNAEDIVVLDLRGVSPVTDYFVICTGTSGRQIRSLSDSICESSKAAGQPVWRVAGQESAAWVVMDFVDVVVHVFDQEHRAYYDLELIWGAAPRVRWQRRASAGKSGVDETTES